MMGISKNFSKIYNEHYHEQFEKKWYRIFYTLIDDAVARVIRSEGGFIWACKNYDGDVMSDMVIDSFVALHDDINSDVSRWNFEYEAAHGTVTRHYYRYLDGEKLLLNPMATIFAWVEH